MNAYVLPQAKSLWVTSLSAHIGAKIDGINIRGSLPGLQVAEMCAALLRWAMIFFRAQFLTFTQHVACSSQCGDLTAARPVFWHVDAHQHISSRPNSRRATCFQPKP
ncbi:hypothetical protein QN360_08465 [Glaciimonas sp. CA11.2]|uniref:hypothetical protein n=1 Tax=Glaciimonas sp. CA11.2 TaxID=3048601 RepID=UPI002AB347FE|nr:hypothetical protein [Glaciimonas sp. CA11.2]MDY7547351.1 hypothetical protein [Glaciimonas sp. CA11.2]MEB0162940.1 hypothetical protein [Glaciimonas sp. CA11.2]